MSMIVNFMVKAIQSCFEIALFLIVLSGSLLAEETRDSLQPSVLISVNQLELLGNTVFSDSELINIITPLENKEVTLDRLLQVRREITDYYTQQGYIATGAFIPPQKLNKGKIKIVVIEGKLSEVEFEKDNIHHKSYIKDRLPSQGSVLNLKTLKSTLSKLQRSPFIKSIDSKITFDSVGNVKLLLDIEENPRSVREFKFSNYFSPNIGRIGGQAKFKFNTFGIGDFFEAGFTQTEGLEQFSALYSLPLNKHDTQLTIKYVTASSTLVLEELEKLDINGDFISYSLELNQLIILKNNQKLDLRFGFNIERSESFILDNFSFSFVDGLDRGDIDISELSFIQEYSKKGLKESFILSSTFNIGVNIFEPTVTRLGRDGLYWNWQFRSQGIIKLSSTFNWISDLKIQLSPDNLLPNKQFSLGGISSIRGYNRNLFLGNNGISVTNELQTPIYKNSNSELRVICFIDAGKVWGNNRANKINQNLFSTGLGLQYSKNQLFNIRLDYALPLTSTKDLKLESSTSNLTFSIQVLQ